MKFYLYSVPLFSKKDKKPNGIMVKLLKSKNEDLESQLIRCYTLRMEESEFIRWNKAFSGVDDGTGWAVLPQTEEELVSKLLGRKVKPRRTPDWEAKIDEYKAWPVQNETSTRYLSSRTL